MELKEMIAMGTARMGDQKRLAAEIWVRADELTHAKSGRRGLPAHACTRLAEIIGIDPSAVLIASSLVTEKNPERRAYLSPFVNIGGKAAA